VHVLLRLIGLIRFIRLLFGFGLSGAVAMHFFVVPVVAVDVDMLGVDTEERGAGASGDADVFPIVELRLVVVVFAHGVLLRELAAGSVPASWQLSQRVRNVRAEVDTVLQATLTLVAKQSLGTLPENMRALLSRDQQACLVCDVRPEDPWA
jgi:hypothetical protein